MCFCSSVGVSSLTSPQHLLVQGSEAGQLEHTGRDVGPESHGAERRLGAGVPQGCDVQAGHLVLHLRGAGEGAEEDVMRPPLTRPACRVSVECVFDTRQEEPNVLATQQKLTNFFPPLM